MGGEFPRNPGRDRGVKNLAEALQTKAVRYKLWLGREVKTQIPAKLCFNPEECDDGVCLP